MAIAKMLLALVLAAASASALSQVNVLTIGNGSGAPGTTASPSSPIVYTPRIPDDGIGSINGSVIFDSAA